MNLGDIRAGVESELQYAPELLAWRQDIRQVVNRVYQNLARTRRWPWLYRTVAAWHLPDLSIASGSGGITMAVGGGPRSFNIPRSVLRDALGFTATTQSNLTEYLQQQLVGGELDIAGGRHLGNGNWEKGPFIIERTTTIVPDSGGTTLAFDLDPRANITSFNGTEGNLALKFPRLRLPADCDALIAIRDDQDVPLESLTPEMARLYLGPRDRVLSAANPAYILEDGGFDALFPRHMVTLNNSGGVRPDVSEFLFARENWPVRQTFTVSQPAGVPGSMTPGTGIRLFLSWYYGGRWGPPSAVVNYTMGDSGSLRITGIPVLPQTTATFEYGRRVGVFMSEGEGAFFFRGFPTSPASTTFDIVTGNNDVTDMAEGLRFARWDEEYPGGAYQYVRVLPRPTGLKRLTLEYWARPRQLVEDTDSPEFAEPFHNLIVWLACIEMCTRFAGGKVLPLFAANAKTIREGLEARYLPQPKNQGHQKGMIGQSEASHANQTVDWHGDS